MITAEELLSRAKVKSVKDQITRSRAVGEMATITCPYCDALNVQGQNFCCETLRKCVITILMGLRQEKIEEAQRRASVN